MELSNSRRILYSASHLSSKYTQEEARAFDKKPSGAVKNVNMLKALNLDKESIAQTHEQISQLPSTVHKQMASILAASTRLAADSGAHLQVAQSLAPIPDSAMLSFLRVVSGTVAVKNPIVTLLADLYEMGTKISPVGRLYLERIEMFPAGVERGELVFTVPMAPGETTTISHKEWATSSRGFEETVQDSFEGYSEKGVTEKTDTSTAAEANVQRSNTLDFGATLSGSYGPVSLTTNVGLKNASEERQSVKASTQKNQEITQKSSSRVRQDHKVSVKIEAKQGMDSTSFKTMTNASTEAIRIDYYKMMRKWRTELYRYGLRMTYDICIPTPGVRIWARWRRIAEIDALLNTTFQFALKPQDITEAWVYDEALKYGIILDRLPPLNVKPPLVYDTIPLVSEPGSGQVLFARLDFDVPDGYEVQEGTLTADRVPWPSNPKQLFAFPSEEDVTPSGNRFTGHLLKHIGKTGRQTITYLYQGISTAGISIDYTCVRQESALEEWQRKVWKMLYDAAQAGWREDNAKLQAERDLLWRSLVGKDTLSLRRLEREEMVRLIMLWLIGPGTEYANAPASIESTLNNMLDDERTFLKPLAPTTQPSPTFARLDPANWQTALSFGDLVKFVQQAVEWENLLYFYYPYFWGSEEQGRDKMLFQHPDPEHENFLRAGYCRVVLTIRPDFEADFTRLVETGSLGGEYTSPYLTVAEEIANHARTNYAGIPPANPEKHARPLLYPQQRQTWARMELVLAAIEKYKIDTGDYPATLAALPSGLKTDDAWGRPLVYTIPGSGNDYDLISLGSDGAEGGEDTAADISAAAGASLMATWFDYTPTSGVDIVVNTKPNEIA
jgi:hypothetical protein